MFNKAKKWLIKLTLKKLLREADKTMDYINKHEDLVLAVLKNRGLASTIDELTDIVGRLIKTLRKLF
jgi:hypothetical protein